MDFDGTGDGRTGFIETHTLNAKQRAILAVGGIVADLMVLFPPFFDIGGLFGGVRFAFVFRPPARDYSVDFHPVIAGQTLLLQLSAVACFTLAALLAVDDRASRLRRSAVWAGGLFALCFAVAFLAYSVLETGRGWLAGPFLICVIPLQFPGGYFLFWLRLSALGFVTLLAAALAPRRSAGAIRSELIITVGAAVFLLLCIATTSAALR